MYTNSAGKKKPKPMHVIGLLDGDADSQSSPPLLPPAMDCRCCFETKASKAMKLFQQHIKYIIPVRWLDFGPSVLKYCAVSNSFSFSFVFFAGMLWFPTNPFSEQRAGGPC